MPDLLFAVIYMYVVAGFAVVAVSVLGGYRPRHWVAAVFVGAVWPIVVVKGWRRAGRA